MTPRAASTGVTTPVRSAGAPRRGLLIGAGAAVLLVAVVGASALLRRDDAGAAPPVTETPSPVVPDPAPTSAAGDPGGSGDARSPATDPSRDDPADAQQSAPPPVQPPRPRLPGPVATVLERQLVALSANPTPARLRAIRDTANVAWSVATTRADSAAAALTLAQAGLIGDDIPECARWAERASSLGATGVDMLLQVCR